MSQLHRKNLYLVRAAVIAALYVALTWFVAPFGLSGMGAIQLRVSEALCILPYFTPAGIPGVALGCLLSNLLTGAHLLDIVFGTLATLIGAIGTRLLRRSPYLAALPPILANTLIVPFVLRSAYGMTEIPMGFLFASVAIGELISAGVLGLMLLFALEKHRGTLFGNK